MRDCEWFQGFLGVNFFDCFLVCKEENGESRNGIKVVRFQ